MEANVTPSAAYGVDIAGGMVTAVKARRRGRAVEHQLVADSLATSSAAWRTLAATIAREQKTGAAMVCAMASAQDSFIRAVEAPFGSIAKARAVLPSLLDVQLPFPLEQCAYHFAGVEKSGAKAVRAVALAMPRDRLRSLIDDARAAGLDPEWIEPEALALWRTRPARGGVRAIVLLHLAADRIVAVAGRDDLPVATFHARTAWPDATDSTAREKLRARIQQFLAGALHPLAETNPLFIISGSSAATSDSLRAALGVDAANWRIADNATTRLARSLAESCLRPGPWAGNLRTGELTHPNTTRHEQRAWMRAAMFIGAAALLLIGTARALPVWLEHRAGSVQQAIEEEVSRFTGAPYVTGQELQIVMFRGAKKSDQESLVDRWLEPGAYPLFARLITTAHANDLYLDSLAIGPREAIIRGSAGERNQANQLVEIFRAAGWVAEVESAGSDPDQRALFSLRARP